MNIPPFLERLLLSNEAVFKNASLGISGQNMVFVPRGKTAVILELSIEPFVNNITANFLDLLRDGYEQDNGSAVNQQTIQRLTYQVQIINDTYSTYLNFRNEFSFTTTKGNGQEGASDLTLSFPAKKEELFLYTDRSVYFNFIYPYASREIGADDTGLTPQYDTPDVRFLPKIQTLPKSPITFYDNTNSDFVEKVEVNSPNLDSYFPVNHQLQNAANETPQMEYLRYFASGNTNSTIEQPQNDGDTLSFTQFLTLPVINVKYALLNKRPADYGLTKPIQ